MSFIAGPYALTYNAQSLGTIAQPIDFELMQFGQRIEGNHLGRSLLDGVYQGGDLFLNFILNEFDAAAARSAFWPFAASFGLVGQPGALYSSFAQALVLTALAGTNATPATLTFTKAVLAPNVPIRTLLGAAHKTIPLRMQVLPTGAGTEQSPYRWWT